MYLANSRKLQVHPKKQVCISVTRIVSARGKGGYSRVVRRLEKQSGRAGHHRRDLYEPMPKRERPQPKKLSTKKNRRGSHPSDARVLTTLTLWAIQAIPTSLDFLTKMFNQAQTPSMSTYSYDCSRPTEPGALVSSHLQRRCVVSWHVVSTISMKEVEVGIPKHTECRKRRKARGKKGEGRGTHTFHSS
jgi:hypothetical protein